MNTALPPPLPVSTPPPLPPQSAWTRKRTGLSIIHIIGLMFLAGIIALFLISDSPAPQPAAAPSEFIESSGNIDIGIELYHRDSKALAGSVKSVEVRHQFADGTTRQGVFVRFQDGAEQWIPRDAVKTLYLVKNPNFK